MEQTPPIFCDYAFNSVSHCEGVHAEYSSPLDLAYVPYTEDLLAHTIMTTEEAWHHQLSIRNYSSLDIRFHNLIQNIFVFDFLSECVRRSKRNRHFHIHIPLKYNTLCPSFPKDLKRKAYSLFIAESILHKYHLNCRDVHEVISTLMTQIEIREYFGDVVADTYEKFLIKNLIGQGLNDLYLILKVLLKKTELPSDEMAGVCCRVVLDVPIPHFHRSDLAELKCAYDLVKQSSDYNPNIRFRAILAILNNVRGGEWTRGEFGSMVTSIFNEEIVSDRSELGLKANSKKVKLIDAHIRKKIYSVFGNDNPYKYFIESLWSHFITTCYTLGEEYTKFPLYTLIKEEDNFSYRFMSNYEKRTEKTLFNALLSLVVTNFRSNIFNEKKKSMICTLARKGICQGRNGCHSCVYSFGNLILENLQLRDNRSS